MKCGVGDVDKESKRKKKRRRVRRKHRKEGAHKKTICELLLLSLLYISIMYKAKNGAKRAQNCEGEVMKKTKKWRG